ncbi:hypothetical protein HOLleu_09495 [Holothuria leucospilota]|uniref:Uncharacterized protein n=1 Tax=Holothuria leucospilota TaxID=206669 RepID=A0A9Q1HEZ6_HOLLE|nr:hypothetical protein HOLleu_09495 [Holothuria leucospilota]
MIHRQMLDVVRLPKSSQITFGGDPMQYWEFMNAFNSYVDHFNVEDSDKLSRLFEYCTGKSFKVGKPCALMNPSEGYKKAKGLLKRRFGNDLAICKAWVPKITEGPPPKPNNCEALQDFADDVRCCIEKVKAMKRLKEVDSQDRMVKILTRLPMYLQARWMKEAYKSRERNGEYPGFDQFVRFLDCVVGEANNPVFGNVGITFKDSKEKRKPTQIKKRGSSFNVEAREGTTSEKDRESKGVAANSKQTSRRVIVMNLRK